MKELKEPLPDAIVSEPFDPETTKHPFGQRWGGQVVRLGPEHLAALQSGQTLALDVQGEYIIFVQLPKTQQPP